MSSTRVPTKSTLLFIGLSLLVAVSYYVTGKLGLLLAIPPGFATAVWAPAGVPLAAVLLGGYRYAFGVFLGSFVTNIDISLSAFTQDTWHQALLVAAAIALGAALQACFGNFLIKRVLHYPNPLYTKRSIFLFALLSGPMSCLVNASISNFALWATSILPFARISINWLTWWIGDTIGVLIWERNIKVTNSQACATLYVL